MHHVTDSILSYERVDFSKNLFPSEEQKNELIMHYIQGCVYCIALYGVCYALN